MIVEIQKRKCLRCGNEFTHVYGGIVLRMIPQCNKCGFILTKKIARIK